MVRGRRARNEATTGSPWTGSRRLRSVGTVQGAETRYPSPRNPDRRPPRVPEGTRMADTIALSRGRPRRPGRAEEPVRIKRCAPAQGGNEATSLPLTICTRARGLETRLRRPTRLTNGSPCRLGNWSRRPRSNAADFPATHPLSRRGHERMAGTRQRAQSRGSHSSTMRTWRGADPGRRAVWEWRGNDAAGEDRHAVDESDLPLFQLHGCRTRARRVGACGAAGMRDHRDAIGCGSISGRGCGHTGSDVPRPHVEDEPPGGSRNAVCV